MVYCMRVGMVWRITPQQLFLFRLIVKLGLLNRAGSISDWMRHAQSSCKIANINTSVTTRWLNPV